ncbi:HD domain-containing protein [Devosia sp.]|uniref:HD domain-containing protein n=1 Tax=Devosia sp. TaxID=1871048 RepID=UPI001A061060|nr:HD domain-containing protein [Devosia sp.]MBE0578879.1 HD domain-containing protein [Devosia sp.]
MISGSSYQGQRIRDPLHDLIEFREAADEFEHMLWRVVQTEPFQRLRRIKQLGFSEFVYPGATHSRFAHSLGVFHTARRLMEVVKRHVPRPSESKIQRALAAALVHDVGHGAFSHAFETVGKRLKLKMADHEHVSNELIRNSEISKELNELGSGFATDVADIIQGSGKKTVYRAVVSSQFDADRLDYMRRDRLMTGTQHSAIDFEWLIANLEVGKVAVGMDDEKLGEVETFVLGPKAFFAAEAFVLGLFQLYPTVYLHKTTRGVEKIFVELLAHVFELGRQGHWQKTGLPENHPLIQFAKNADDLSRALLLDDSVVSGALPMMMDADDPLIADFSRRLRTRDLYKCMDVRAGVTQTIDPDGVGDDEKVNEIDAACERINLKLTDWSSASGSVPRALFDSAERSPYKEIGQTKGPLDQINIRTEGDKLVDLKSRSQVVASLKTFKLARAYVSREDPEAVEMVEKLTKELGK